MTNFNSHSVAGSSGLTDQTQKALPRFDRVTATDHAQAILMRAIVRGELRSGDPLIETELAAQLGISRGPVREALVQLEHIGLAEKVPYKGTYVSQLTEQDVHELYTIRSPVEGLAARLIAGRRDSAAVVQLAEIVARMGCVGEGDDTTALVELDFLFHDTLCRLSKHKLLYQIWATQLGARLKRFLFLKEARLYVNPREAELLHGPIVDATRSGHPGRARAAAMQHVVEAGERHFRSQAIK